MRGSSKVWGYKAVNGTCSADIIGCFLDGGVSREAKNERGSIVATREVPSFNHGERLAPDVSRARQRAASLACLGKIMLFTWLANVIKKLAREVSP